MPQLEWNETEFIECLEILPTVDDYASNYVFEVKKHGLILQLTVWQYESVVQLAVFQEQVEAAIIQMTLFVQSEVRYIKKLKSEFLEFRRCIPAASSYSYLDFPKNPANQKEYPYDLNVWLFVKPHIRIHFVK